MKFYKYQGTGNDFIMIDNRNLDFPKDNNLLIEQLCDRRFGIGADGLILLENETNYDFRMCYYNADGNESSMCGNGGRCIVAFAHFLDIFEERTTFIAIDGAHEAELKNNKVKLKMIDVDTIKKIDEDYELNTGSPHYIQYVDDVENYDVYHVGNKIRNSDTYIKEGINVNFVSELPNNEIFVRTYERGVEDETFSCGTGATAAALTFMSKKHLTSVPVKVLGGQLKIYAEHTEEHFKNIWLEGPTQKVFEGKIDI